MAHFNFFLKYETGDVFLDEIEAEEYRVSSRNSCHPPAPSSSSGASSNSQRTTSHVAGHPPAPSSSSRASSNPRFVSRAARNPSANSAFCQPSRSLDDTLEEYKCCKGECLANLGTPIEIAEFKAGALKKLNAADVKVNSLLF